MVDGKQARAIAMAEPLFFNFYVAKKDVLDVTGKVALEGAKYVELDTDLSFLHAKLDKGQGIPLNGLTVASYVGTLLLAQVVAENQNIQTTSDLQAVLMGQHEVRTPDHIYPIKNRYVNFPLAVKAMRDGKAYKEETKRSQNEGRLN